MHSIYIIYIYSIYIVASCLICWYGSVNLHSKKLLNYIEEEERKLYFNNLLHIHQHTFFKIHDIVGY